MGILDHIMSEDEMKQDAESFANGLPDREADAAKDAEIWANKLPDKK